VAWLWRHDRRRSAWFVGILGTLVTLIFLYLNVTTRGGFYLNTVWVNALGSYRLDQVLAGAWRLLLIWPVAIILAGVAVANAVRPSAEEAAGVKCEDEGGAFLRAGLLPYTIAALLSALTVGKIGSDVNYLLEPIAALAIWAGIGVAWWLERQRAGRSVLILLLIAQVLLSLLLGWRAVGVGLLTRWRNISDYDWVFRRVQIAARRGPILADDYLGMVVLAGQPIYYQPFDYRQLYAAGKWDPSGLIAEVEARKFSLILLNGRGTRVFDERWIPAIVQAIDASYCSSERVGDLVLYEPSTQPCASSP
jgi:hypothetical protein